VRYEDYGLTDLKRIASDILDQYPNERIFIFRGELGAGKTSLIKEFCKTLGVKEGVSSPTFSLINEYKAGDNKIYHFDFYRLKNLEEAIDIGSEDYFFSGDYCLIEWPELILPLLPETFIKLDFEFKDKKRSLTINPIGDGTK